MEAFWESCQEDVLGNRNRNFQKHRLGTRPWKYLTDNLDKRPKHLEGHPQMLVPIQKKKKKKESDWLWLDWDCSSSENEPLATTCDFPSIDVGVFRFIQPHNCPHLMSPNHSIAEVSSDFTPLISVNGDCLF